MVPTAKVLVDGSSGLEFDYSIPKNLHALVVVGSRVKVNLRNRPSTGTVVDLSSVTEGSGEASYLKPISELITDKPILTPVLIELGRWISNYYVASIKHAHHSFEIDQPHTDSYFHRKAGAREVIISSSNRWAKIKELNTENEKNLQELIKELESPDIVIIEGFKNSSHSKIEIINDNNDNYLFPRLDNVIALVTKNKIKSSLPQFQISNIEEIAKFILKNAK